MEHAAPAREAPGTLDERWARLPGLTRIPEASGAAALTFDDGPDPDGTPAVLDALDAAAATATFFVVGEQLVRHHRVAREVVERGHELALHGFTHADQSLLSPQETRDELVRGVWAFESILGRRPRWYRPPYGRVSAAGHQQCRELGLNVVYWSALGQDWRPATPQQIAAFVAAGLTDGAIVLLHDSARYAERATAEATAAAVRLFGTRARGSGLALRSLGELVPAR